LILSGHKKSDCSGPSIYPDQQQDTGKSSRSVIGTSLEEGGGALRQIEEPHIRLKVRDQIKFLNLKPIEPYSFTGLSRRSLGARQNSSPVRIVVTPGDRTGRAFLSPYESHENSGATSIATDFAVVNGDAIPVPLGNRLAQPPRSN
jgi:hypothetical protein